MAKEEKVKIILEREYNVPLRREWLKAPRWNRSKKASKALKEFLRKHMKSEDVRIGKELNEKIWERGIRNPPHHVKVKVTKDSEGVVMAELAEAVKKEKTPKKAAEKKEEEKKAEE